MTHNKRAALFDFIVAVALLSILGVTLGVTVRLSFLFWVSGVMMGYGFRITTVNLWSEFWNYRPLPRYTVNRAGAMIDEVKK